MNNETADKKVEITKKNFGNKLQEYCCDIPLINKVMKDQPKVAVLRMAGVIADGATMRKSGISYQKFSKVLDKTFGTKGIKAVALVINSPGGSPAQCSLITDQIRKLAEDKEVEVFAFIEDVAASGGYWIACAADEIYAQESSIVGSIGVISAGFGFEDFIDKYSVKRRVHTSGTEKSFLDPFLPEKPGDVKRLKAIQAEIHGSFKSWVQSRRGDRLNGTEQDLMEGAFWTGKTAVQLGLIDGLGTMKSVLKEKFGADTKFIDFAPDKKLLPPLLPFAGQAQMQQDWVQMALNTAEDRATWQRYGL